jgi:hypothetical protein
MVALNDAEKSRLRRNYEKLGSRQGGLSAWDSTLQQLETEEILRVLAENESDPFKWPTFTDLDDHIRNIARLKSYGVPITF